MDEDLLPLYMFMAWLFYFTMWLVKWDMFMFWYIVGSVVFIYIVFKIEVWYSERKENL